MSRSTLILLLVMSGLLADRVSAQEATPERSTEGQAQDQSEMKANTGDDDDIDDLIVERAMPRRRAGETSQSLEATPTRPATDVAPDPAGTPQSNPRFRTGKELKYGGTALTGTPTRQANCGTFWTGWVNTPEPDTNPCPAGCSRGERLQQRAHKQDGKTLYDVQYQCTGIAGAAPAAAGAQSTSRAGIDAAPAGSLTPASGSWGTFVTLNSAGLASSKLVRIEWYPDDDGTQMLSGMLSATVRGRTPPDQLEIEMPLGAGGSDGAVVRVFALADHGAVPTFVGRFTIGETPSRLAASTRLGNAVITPTSPGAPTPAPTPTGTPTVSVTPPAPDVPATSTSNPSGVRPVGSQTAQTLGQPGTTTAPAAVPAAAVTRAADRGDLLEVRDSVPGPVLTEVSVTASSIDVRWQPVAGAANYQIHATEAGANQAATGVIIPAGTGTGDMSGSLAGLTSGFGYSVWVRVNYADGRFAPSEIREVTLADPVNPDNLQAVREGERGARLTWNPVPGVSGYRVVGPNAPEQQIQTAFLVVPDLGDGDHQWQVMSVYGRGVYNAVTARSVRLLIESRGAMVERAFNAGQANYPDAGPDPARWKRLALESDFSFEKLVSSFASLWVVTQAYQYLLERDATFEETRATIEQLNGGWSWREVWRTVAQSTERDQRFGFWAPAPMFDLGQARVTFGQNGLNNGQACYGGLGDGCDSPEVGEPEWDTGFALPDGTRMGFVTLSVAVGSILHDNACLQNRNGLHCDNQAWHWVAERLPFPTVAYAISPAAIEWNKASWNFFDGRKWRTRFGPYPVEQSLRRADWYDDLRDAPARTAYMAPVYATMTIPVQNQRYPGRETRRTRGLRAPAGTSIDSRDAEFCASGAFSRTESFIGKADWGYCR